MNDTIPKSNDSSKREDQKKDIVSSTISNSSNLLMVDEIKKPYADLSSDADGIKGNILVDDVLKND